jgi:peptidoglycan/xylan/chitin deacetylase (PgdA/CDA1 family)
MTSERLRYPHRGPGLDHNWFTHQPTHLRPPITWPSSKPLALWITVPVEFFPLDAPLQPVRVLGALDRGYPDFWTYSGRDYGLRVGIYRIMRVLDGLGLRATAAVNAAVADRYPRVIDELLKRDWEIAASGIDMGHIHHGKLAPDAEQALVRRTRDVLTEASGQPIGGWYSPGHSESSHTLRLLAEADFEYVMDWTNDDLPYTISTEAGTLTALPLTYEWSDRLLLVQHNLTVDEYSDDVMRAFRRLLGEAERFQCGRILSLSVSPWVLGYPHRISTLESLLTSIVQSNAIWAATGIEVVRSFVAQKTGDP